MCEYSIATICCSTRYIDKILKYYNELTAQGYVVLANLMPYNNQDEFDKEMVDDMHLSKIGIADEVHFLLKDDEMDESVEKEFQYALKINAIMVIKDIDEI